MAARTVSALAEERTVQVLNVLPHRGGGGETYVDMLERLDGYAHERFFLSSGRSPASALASLPGRLPRLAARLRAAELVHVHGDAASAIVLPLLGIRPAVLTTHGLHLLRRSHGVRRRLVASCLRQAVASSCRVICTSASEHEDLSLLARPGDREKLRMIPNGIDPPAPLAEYDRRVLRAELGAATDDVLGLFAGQLEPRKAPLPAAHAAREARARGAPFVLALAGDGPQAQELRALAGEAVRPLGFRPDLGRLMGAADVFVQPSEREGMSLALLDAMGHGLAVVAADGPGNPEAVGEAGLLVRAGDQGALAEALIRLSSNPELRADLGARARARVLEHFSAERFLAATEQVYREALTAPARAAGGAPA